MHDKHVHNSRKQHYYYYSSDITQGCSFLVNTTHLVQQRARNCQTLACFPPAAISTTQVAYPSDDPCYATSLISPGRPSSVDQCQQLLLPWSRPMSPDNGLVSCHRLLLLPVETKDILNQLNCVEHTRCVAKFAKTFAGDNQQHQGII